MNSASLNLRALFTPQVCLEFYFCVNHGCERLIFDDDTKQSPPEYRGCVPTWRMRHILRYIILVMVIAS
jgi:hypothetical protein